MENDGIATYAHLEWAMSVIVQRINLSTFSLNYNRYSRQFFLSVSTSIDVLYERRHQTVTFLFSIQNTPQRL